MVPLVLAALLLVPVATDESVAPELAIVQDFLHETDSPLVMGNHCARHGGAQTWGDLPPADEPLPLGTNGHLHEHLSWHLRHASVVRATVDPSVNDRYGDEFIAFHHEMIGHYDAWREAHGLDPVVAWDPATPIPAAFAYPAGPGCRGRENEDPKVPIPTWATFEGGDEADPVYGHRALCEFDEANDLAKVIDATYHSDVHGGVGGDMQDPFVSPREPIFWGWHKFLDESVFQRYLNGCADGAPVATAAIAPPAGAGAREMPGAGAAALLAAVVLAAWVGARRSAR